MTEPVKCTEGMLHIPEGTFRMGYPNPSIILLGKDHPVRDVYVSGFCMDKHEVTNAEYSSYEHPQSPRIPVSFDGPDQPVVNVNWHDADAYCESQGKRLPTEAEWEKAARGPEGYDYGTKSGELNRNEANYSSSVTADVCSFPENGYGLCDMTGNAEEWTADWFDWYAYEILGGVDPYKHSRTGGLYAFEIDKLHEKTIRGGGWHDDSLIDLAQLASYRSSNFPDREYSDLGFRCVKGQPYTIGKETFKQPEIRPPNSCLCNTPGHVGDKSVADISLFSLLKMLIFD